MILDHFPSAETFYKTYWNKQPFVVRNAINQELFEDFIDPDHLAGLALEDEIKSRIVTTSENGKEWSCEHGPFDEDHFSTLGETNWSLLVQNVEQYHHETAHLLQSISVSPRWLMDDIMVSYSTPRGSVGPHTDSYHVFLVQGMGKRQWKVGNAPLQDEDYIEGKDLKVLKNDFDGTTVDVAKGDIIYIPPHFAHQGTTIEDALTFSIGFLGPTLSEMMSEFSLYLEQSDVENTRFCGDGLDIHSDGFNISKNAEQSVQASLVNAIQSDVFSAWMAEYFSGTSHDDSEACDTIDEPLSSAEIKTYIEEGRTLYRPEHIKLTLTTSIEGTVNIAAFGKVVATCTSDSAVIASLNVVNSKNFLPQPLSEEDFDVVLALYNNGVLAFTDNA